MLADVLKSCIYVIEDMIAHFYYFVHTPALLLEHLKNGERK